MVPLLEDDAGLIWEIVLDDPAAVERMLPHALARVALLAGAAKRAELAVPLATATARHVVLSRPAPDRLRFLNTATGATAGKWAQAPVGTRSGKVGE